MAGTGQADIEETSEGVRVMTQEPKRKRGRPRKYPLPKQSGDTTERDDPDALTPTEQRLIDLLADGNVHSQQDMLGCLSDELASVDALNTHLCRLRGKIRLRAMDVATFQQPCAYQLRRIINNPYR